MPYIYPIFQEIRPYKKPYFWTKNHLKACIIYIFFFRFTYVNLIDFIVYWYWYWCIVIYHSPSPSDNLKCAGWNFFIFWILELLVFSCPHYKTGAWSFTHVYLLFFVPELCPWFLFMPPRWRVGGGGHINLPLSVLSSVRI